MEKENPNNHVKELTMTVIHIPSAFRLLKENTQAMIIDVQDKLAPHIHDIDNITHKITILVKGLQALNVQIMLNEQYPKGLGVTLPVITNALTTNHQQVYEKREFSVCDSAESWNYLAKQNRNNVILCGIEAHVCVQQTALDLLDNGMQPVLIADAIGSRNPYDKKVAIRRMRRAGAIVTTTEAILFELCRTSKDDAFKTISQLVK